MSIFIDGVTTYSNPGSNISTGSTSPNPPAGFTDYDFNATAGALAYRTFTLPGDGPWQFRMPVYVSAATAVDLDWIAMRTAGDTVNALIVRNNGADKMRVVANGGGFFFTATPTTPHDTFYLLQGFGNSLTNAGRIALCDYTTGTALTNADSTTAGSTIAQGSTGLTALRYGKCSGATGWAGKVAWRGLEFRTGTDAAQAFLGPFTANTAPSVTLQITGSNRVNLGSTIVDAGGISSILWEITSWPAGSTKPTINAPTTEDTYFDWVAPGNYGIRQTVTDNGSPALVTVTNTSTTVGGGAPTNRKVWNGTAFV